MKDLSLLAGSYASPEWQARSMWWRGRDSVVACPLEGCVRSVATLPIRSRTVTTIKLAIALFTEEAGQGLYISFVRVVP